ncbi:MAG: hypothetical protein ACK5LL_02425, partial [Suipraeoptans sp.]
LEIHYNFIGTLDTPAVACLPSSIMIDTRQGVAVEYITRKADNENRSNQKVTPINGMFTVLMNIRHGYLLSQFLSPFFNQRTDEYGGNISNRARIVFEVYESIRNAVGENYPVWVKINSADFADNGLSFEESLWVCKELDKRGINGIEVSGGIGVSAESAPTRILSDKNEQGAFSEYALTIADSVNATVISVGGYRTANMIEQWLNKGNVNAFSLCRPLICEPNLPSVWQGGDDRKAKCISCNKCFDYSSGFGCKVFN